jgi:hypothetical protein
MIALVIRGKIHRNNFLVLHAIIGQTRGRDQHAVWNPVRKIAGCPLVEAVSVHLPAGIDNALAEIGMIVICHDECSEKAIQD